MGKDNDDWRYQKTKTCKWVAEKKTNRCKKSGKIGKAKTSAKKGCPSTCDQCKSACEDSSTWMYGKTNVGCTWVGENPEKRCSKKGVDGDKSGKANKFCLKSCGKCGTRRLQLV